MIDEHQYKRIQLANPLPLNQAAMKFLPKDWGMTAKVAVLSWAMVLVATHA